METQMILAACIFIPFIPFIVYLETKAHQKANKPSAEYEYNPVKFNMGEAF